MESTYYSYVTRYIGPFSGPYRGVRDHVPLGFAFAATFALLEALQPGSFLLGHSQLPSVWNTIDELIYYSFVTVTTLGYGDITPARPMARSPSNLEALVAQLYLTVLIARLVGMHVANKLQPDC